MYRRAIPGHSTHAAATEARTKIFRSELAGPLIKDTSQIQNLFFVSLILTTVPGLRSYQFFSIYWLTFIAQQQQYVGLPLTMFIIELIGGIINKTEMIVMIIEREVR